MVSMCIKHQCCVGTAVQVVVGDSEGVVCRFTKLEQSGALRRYAEDYGYDCRNQEEFKACPSPPYKAIMLASSTSPPQHSLYALVYLTQTDFDCKNVCTYCGHSSLSL